MRVLIACEESQAVCKAFRALGHEAFSCDVQECSGGHPEWHVKGDALHLINGRCLFTTMDGQRYYQMRQWDLLIAHPPCTYLSSVGAARLFGADHQVKDPERERLGFAAKDFFMRFLSADCEKICVENPAPLKYYGLPPYSQIIEPYQYGHPYKKRTCLWLKGLPELVPTDIVEPTGCWVVSGGGPTCRVKLTGGKSVRDPKLRSKTFPGIARAMAEQWGGVVE